MQLTDSSVFFRICCPIVVVKIISLLLYINSISKENQVVSSGLPSVDTCWRNVPLSYQSETLQVGSVSSLHDSVYVPTWRKLFWSQLKESQVERSWGWDRWGCLGWFSKASLCGFQKTPYRYSWMHSYASLPI